MYGWDDSDAKFVVWWNNSDNQLEPTKGTATLDQMLKPLERIHTLMRAHNSMVLIFI